MQKRKGSSNKNPATQRLVIIKNKQMSHESIINCKITKLGCAFSSVSQSFIPSALCLSLLIVLRVEYQMQVASVVRVR